MNSTWQNNISAFPKIWETRPAYDYEAWIELALQRSKIKAMIKQLNDLAVEIQELKEKCEQLKKDGTNN